jgi:hypothetical protein
MTPRQRFSEIMNFNTDIRTMKWEYAYWGATIKRWYREGLQQKNLPVVPEKITTIGASLYSTAWNYRWKDGITESAGTDKIKDGMAIWGDGTYYPTQGFPLERDVHDYFSFDPEVVRIDIEDVFCPRFEPEVLEEDPEFIIYRDLDGISRKFLRSNSVIPSACEWPITGRKSWERIKEERLDLGFIRERLGEHWEERATSYRESGKILSLGGYPCGLFGLPAHLLGYENLFVWYYDDPALVHDILSTFTDVWLALWEEVLSWIEIDVVHIFEDISSGTGSMVSPALMKEFMLPYYKRITSFLEEKGVGVVLLDTDGDCSEIIPIFLEGGITGLYPMETSTGMDLLEIRKKYPQLQMMGGVSKRELGGSNERIDAALAAVPDLLEQGGYIPFVDHSVPPDVSWDNFVYYRKKLNEMIGRD